MTIEARVAKVFRLDDLGWARHANPLSGWTRFTTCLPLFVLAVWSRVWLGYGSLVPIALAVAWIVLNPRAFGPAPNDHAWITKGVLGERLWSDRHRMPVPERHNVLPHVLNVAALAGLPFLIWGLAVLEVWPTFVGLLIVIGSKLWYIDRMALLYEDTVSRHPELRYRPADSVSAHQKSAR